MNKFYITNNGAVFGMDPEKDMPIMIQSMWLGIDNAYVLEEDCELISEDKRVNGKKGDILVTFYSKELPNRFAILNSEELRINAEARKEQIKKNNEAMKAKAEATSTNDTTHD